ncbi:MAG: epoxyqueuosine reductase QueH [Spirochaetes bacterium]|nr:epoxyqueuosine reductase QueH [Spirochaetota bacterium]
MKKLLLHTCCAPCVSYVFELLKNNYEITCYFYNPNILPYSEYHKRLDELENFCTLNGINLVIPENEVKKFYKKLSQLRHLGEKSGRCLLCYKMRLRSAAEYASANGFDVFGTVLSISPHKVSSWINEAGKELEEQFGTEYLEADFKKNDGFKKSCELSLRYGFYRQNYCGCIYSKNERKKLLK